MDEKSVRDIRSLAAPPGGHAGRATQQSTVANPDPPHNGEVCPLCNGTGWSPVEKDGTVRVRRCQCFLRAKSDHLIRLSEIPERHRNCEFSNYYTNDNQTLAVAKMTVQRWAEQYPMDHSGLILIGPSGVGKTHLIVAAVKILAQKGMQSLFCYYGELLKKIQNSYNPQSQITELQVLKPIFDADVLVLDDLGVVKPTEWVWDAVSIILNTRYNDNRTTLITSNFEDAPAAKLGTTPVQFATRKDTLGDRIGERMRSRLFEMCRLVRLDGRDYREKKRHAQ
ncbi:MAG TPA: ATP-binding protein [Terriglobales bacterium]|nr:ATP-binding protein [Terriglobales bacterium]